MQKFYLIRDVNYVSPRNELYFIKEDFLVQIDLFDPWIKLNVFRELLVRTTYINLGATQVYLQKLEWC